MKKIAKRFLSLLLVGCLLLSAGCSSIASVRSAVENQVSSIKDKVSSLTSEESAEEDSSPASEVPAEETADAEEQATAEAAETAEETDVAVSAEEDTGTGTVTDVASDIFQFIGQDHEWMTAHYVAGIPRSELLAERFITTDAGFPAYTDEAGDVTSKFGIDVSQFQGDIDWQQVAASGVEFAIVRVALRGYGEEGTLRTDSCYEANLSGAAAAGLTVGAYFFSQAVSEEEAVDEAEFLLDALDGYSITGPVVYDLEEITGDTARTDGMSAEQLTACAIAFCSRISEAGYQPVVYANLERFIYDYDLTELLDYGWWLADYNEQPQLPYRISYWQFSSSGSIPGISGNVDLDLCF